MFSLNVDTAIGLLFWTGLIVGFSVLVVHVVKCYVKITPLWVYTVPFAVGILWLGWAAMFLMHDVNNSPPTEIDMKSAKQLVPVKQVIKKSKEEEKKHEVERREVHREDTKERYEESESFVDKLKLKNKWTKD